MRKNDFKISFFRRKITSLVTSLMTSLTVLRIFPPNLVHSPDAYLQNLWSDKAVRCLVLSQIVPPISFGIDENRQFCARRSSGYEGRIGNLDRFLESPDDALSYVSKREPSNLPPLICKNGFKMSFFRWKIASLVTSFMTSSTALRIFTPSLVHSPHVYLENLWSDKPLRCMVLSQIVPPIRTYNPLKAS